MENKRQSGLILTYDLHQVPRGMKFDDVLKLAKDFGICVYDGGGGEYAPKVLDFGGEGNEHFRNLKIIDISKF